MQPSRWVGLLNLLQGAAYAYGAYWLQRRWGPAAVVAAACALAQLAGGGLLLVRGQARGARIASALTLVGAAILLGMFAAAASVIATSFGVEARKAGLESLGVVAIASPWALAFPLWQVLSSRRGAGRGAAVLALVFGAAWGATRATLTPDVRWAPQPDRVAAAEAAWQRWAGVDVAAALPSGAGPATVLLTPWRGGLPGDPVRGDGATLADAVEQALQVLPPPEGPGAALVLDVAREAWDAPLVLVPGESGGLSKQGGVSPTSVWRPGSVTRIEVLPGWRVPWVKLGRTRAALFDSAVADADGARGLRFGWTEPDATGAAAYLAAALEGGRMLARHQRQDGRFAYAVAGPSGEVQGGYNFPRHAGVVWFLARLAVRTGDEGVRAAAERGMDYLREHTTTLSDGRAFVRDPGRRDGKVWVGTTALAALAAATLDDPIGADWGKFLASSVDDVGQARGDMVLDSEAFPDQPRNPYGQGQTTLALAALVRAGDTDLRPALDRAAAYVDGDYAPGGAGRLIVLDEHWACLSALAVRDVTGVAAGWEICRSYLHSQAQDTPAPGGAVHLSSGAAGGLAEAVVAGAVLEPDGPLRDAALAFADVFVREAYRAGDSPFLGDAPALLGGFRDGVASLDVRMDAVQHIGCALLGAEALVSGPGPGSLP